MNIGIVIGSIRNERNGEAVGNYILEQVTQISPETTFELVDLKTYDLPFLGATPTEEQAAAIGAWSTKIASFDGYIFVTPEYNRAVPGAFKNALDFLQPELHNKAVGYVGYGGLGALSSIETLRLINAEQEMASVRTMVTFSLMTDFENMSVFKPAPYHADSIQKMLGQVLSWSKALKTIR